MAAKLTAILGVCKRRGRWQVSGQTKALVLFGHCYIDYREAYADPELEKMKLSITCVFGNATFVVPEGSDIQPSVVSMLAATAFDVPKIDIAPPLPTLVIESTTLLGRCRVVTSPPGEQDQATDEDLPQATARVTTIDHIGPVPSPEIELPPLEAVAKALLADSPARARATEREQADETGPERAPSSLPQVEVEMPSDETAEAA